MNETPREWDLPLEHVGRHVVCYGLVDSTNARALDLARDPANAGVAVVAGEQMAGRGRLGRTWQAKPGSSVLLSVVLFPPEPLRKPAILTAWAAVAVARLVREVTRRPGRIKWPNDVLLDGKKVAGILLEQAGPADGRSGVVAGIGVNCTQTAREFADAGLPDATSFLDQAIRHPEPTLVMGCLLRLLNQEYGWLLERGPGPLESAWRRGLDLVGREVEVEGGGAGLPESGVLRGRLRRVGFAGVELTQPDGGLIRMGVEQVQQLRGVGASPPPDPPL